MYLVKFLYLLFTAPPIAFWLYFIFPYFAYIVWVLWNSALSYYVWIWCDVAEILYTYIKICCMSLQLNISCSHIYLHHTFSNFLLFFWYLKFTPLPIEQFHRNWTDWISILTSHHHNCVGCPAEILKFFSYYIWGNFHESAHLLNDREFSGWAKSRQFVLGKRQWVGLIYH